MLISLIHSFTPFPHHIRNAQKSQIFQDKKICNRYAINPLPHFGRGKEKTQRSNENDHRGKPCELAYSRQAEGKQQTHRHQYLGYANKIRHHLQGKDAIQPTHSKMIFNQRFDSRCLLRGKLKNAYPKQRKGNGYYRDRLAYRIFFHTTKLTMQKYTPSFISPLHKFPEKWAFFPEVLPITFL